MNKKRLEVRLPEDNPIWTIPKGTRAEIVNKALLMFFGNPWKHESCQELVQAIRETKAELVAALKEIKTELAKKEEGVFEKELQDAQGQKEEKPSVAEHLRKMIKEIWDTDEEGTS